MHFFYITSSTSTVLLLVFSLSFLDLLVAIGNGSLFIVPCLVLQDAMLRAEVEHGIRRNCEEESKFYCGDSEVVLIFIFYF